MSGTAGGIKLPISADATSVTRAFEDISKAIDRAGQSGRALEDLDLSHPELKDLAADIQNVRVNLDSLLTVGRGQTAAAARKLIDGSGANLFGPGGLMDTSARAFPDPNERNRFVNNAGGYILSGTRYEPQIAPGAAPPPPPTPPRPRSAADEEGGERPGKSGLGAIGSIAGAFLGNPLVKVALAASGISGIAHLAGQAVGQAGQESGENDSLMRHIGGAAEDFDKLRDSVRETSKGLQLTYQESQQLSMSWARMTNELDPSKISDGVKYAVGFSRGYGIDPNQTTAAFAKAQYLGEDPKHFAALIAEATQSGDMHGQVDQTMQALLSWSETASRTLMTHTNVGEFSRMYAEMNATKEPGLMGANGQALIGQVDAGIQRGGGAGVASTALIYRAFMKHGLGNDPYRNQFQMEEGAFGKLPDGTTNFEAMSEELKRSTQGMSNYQRWSVEGNVWGVNAHQAQALEKIDTKKFKQHYPWFSDEADLTKVSASGLNDIASVMDPKADLGGWRQRLLDRTGDNALTDEERKSLTAAGPDDLRRTLLHIIDKHGMETTEGTRAKQSGADMSNALTTVGNSLLPLVTDLKEGTAILIKQIGDLGETIKSLAPNYHMDDKQFGKSLADQARETLKNTLNDPLGLGHPSKQQASVIAAVRASAPHYGLDPDRMAALYQTEGGTAPDGTARISGKGAIGPSQLMPGTASDLHVNPFDMGQNIAGGLTYFQHLLKQFGGDYDVADAAYNAGPNNPGVLKYAKSHNLSDLPTEAAKYVSLNHAHMLANGPGAGKAPAGGAAGSEQAIHAKVSAEPLRVIHETPAGEQIGEQFLPMSAFPLPSPAGASADPARG